MFLSHRNQLTVIYCFAKVFDLLVIIGFIGVKDRSLGQLIGIIL